MKPADRFDILIVDDHAANRYIKHHLLARHGYRVLEAATGRQALEMVKAHQPDLVMLDVHLPDLDGIAVCGMLKDAPPAEQPMVLQTSAQSIRSADRVTALEAGADGYLIEPAEPEELLAVVRSLLRLRRAERELMQARREAEAANAAKSHFLASASHDLRQPMQAQRLFFSALEAQLTTDNQRAVARKLSESLTASESLLRALMDVSALDACAITPSPADVDLVPILQRVIDDHLGEAEGKGLRLRLRARPARVHADPVLLERIVRNLVSNAIRYTDAGGVLVACRPHDGQIRVEVWDTGVGIADQDLDAIFTDFYQVGNNERSRAKGLGLGLAVAARMAKLLDCQLVVRSHLGRGSVFALSVPAPKQPETARPPCAHRAGGALRDLSVMVVEDDADQLIGLTMLLEGWGCTVVHAQDSRKALELIDAGQRPVMVLTDYRLPGDINGLDLLQEMRRRGAGFLKGVVQTGDTHSELANTVAACGYTLLHKPYDAARLHATLQAAQAEMLRQGVKEEA